MGYKIAFRPVRSTSLALNMDCLLARANVSAAWNYKHKTVIYKQSNILFIKTGDYSL